MAKALSITAYENILALIDNHVPLSKDWIQAFYEVFKHDKKSGELIWNFTNLCNQGNFNEASFRAIPRGFYLLGNQTDIIGGKTYVVFQCHIAPDIQVKSLVDQGSNDTYNNALGRARFVGVITCCMMHDHSEEMDKEFNHVEIPYSS